MRMLFKNKKDVKLASSAFGIITSNWLYAMILHNKDVISLHALLSFVICYSYKMQPCYNIDLIGCYSFNAAL